MKRETLFEKFDLFVDAPDAVAKMRNLDFPQRRGDAENKTNPPRLCASAGNSAP